ncbi:hypothetical protein VSDG_05863 [Cytospora chrysosperma]|uniref:WRKY transcription factor 19 n=1 Tax=Cytospora chrysosperma TaxID=252740 RepID=A0A423VVQ2_CYTCH|nr:hypothetical protein VSDG_05863 [Valsa sordida]
MWDMMFYGGAPYSRCCRKSRRSSKKGRKCRACREHIGKVTVGGKKVDMAYCEKHHCQKVLANGSVCQEQRNGRNPLWKYCDLHLRCQAPGSDDMPCMKYVKDADPEKFKYCSDHGCRYPHCEQTKHEGSRGYCPQHSCLANKARKDACDQPRLVQDGSPFCERHTCEWPTCTAEAEGRGERGDAGRSCEQHRRCAAEGCAGACFRRDTGAALRWCGLHYCHRDPCPEPRAPGSERFCDRHVCVEPTCGAGRKEEVAKRGGRFCADHQCRADGCLERRDLRVRGAEYCALHICWVEGCPRPAAAAAGNHRCPASTPGGTQCDKRLDSGQRYCRDHSCELSSCGDQRRPDSLQYCPAHRCAAPACQQLRKNTIAGLVRPDDLLMLAGGGGGGGTASRASLLFSLAAGGSGGGGGLVAPLSSYCSAHACQGDGGRSGACTFVFKLIGMIP